ncbi:MAG: DUF4097 family beta strand repeat-containing protein [Candidatus Poribacteria bacterium]|nr:DUF4097 family beta strand repeat-containing protein [Candidatus Poribacteria bacterium]
MKRILLSITVLLFFLSSLVIPASAQYIPSAVKDALNSIVAIEIDDAQGKTISRGLGFFVSHNQVVTHLSNLKDFTPVPKGAEIYVKLVGKRTRYFVNSISMPDQTDHLAFLNISIPGVKPLSISNKTKHSGTVYTISDPSKPKLVKGTVKGNSKNGKYIRVSNQISQKNRGGPLLNSKGEIIGVSMLLTGLNSKFIYDDGNVSISTGKIISDGSSKINIGGSAFAVSSNVLKRLLTESNSDVVNSRRLKTITDPRKSRSNRIEKTFNVNSGGLLIIDTEIGNIDVQTVAQDKVNVIVTKELRKRLDVYQEALDDFKVTFDEKGSDLSIKGEFERGRDHWRRQLSDLKISFKVTVPSKYDVDLDTPSGNISVDGVTGKSNAKTSAGNIDVSNIVGPVKANTSAGNLRFDEVKGSILGRSAAGNITLSNCQGSVDTRTSAGNINADIATQPQHEWNLQTSAGNIVFTLLANLAAEIDAQTSIGIISTDFLVEGTEIRQKRLRGTIKGGGKLLKLRTSAGNIRLKSR